MIKLNISNSTVTELKSEHDYIAKYLDNIYQRGQGFYNVVDDKKMVDDVLKFAKKMEGKFKDIVVLGIGGSALGTICLQQSLKHLYENELENRKWPRLHVLDNIDPLFIKQLEDIISPDKTLFITISKSGDTPETLAQYFYFRSVVEKKGLNVKDHFVFITDAEKGFLREISQNEDIPSFEIPENIGGRFSVLTPVGLLPAALIGIDIKELLSGAAQMRELFYSDSVEHNLPFQIATIQYLLSFEGKIMTVLIPYSQKLIRFADWYRQLLAESIGKAKDDHGNTVNIGLTPINALGVTDQHSQNQLYNEGPNDKFFIFIRVNDFGCDMKIPVTHPENKSVNYLKGVSFEKLMHTEQEGTLQALTQNERPNITLEIDRVDEKTIGGMFMLFECATAFLGEFFNINAFDQPGVELSKKITKKLLT
ncbi:glucose-6-phosphate isomerase [bacterium]|nr:glucose-6-phosphate isomerase [bacterium]